MEAGKDVLGMANEEALLKTGKKSIHNCWSLYAVLELGKGIRERGSIHAWEGKLRSTAEITLCEPFTPR